MSSQYEQVGRFRAALLIDIKPPTDPDQLEYAVDAARNVGRQAAAITHFFALPRRFTAEDYVELVVKPCYIAGMASGGLYDTWRARVTGGNLPRRLSDPRVKAFVKSANEMVRTRGKG